MPRTSLYSKAKYSCEEKKHLLISTKGDKTSESKRQDKKGAAGVGLVPLEESGASNVGEKKSTNNAIVTLSHDGRMAPKAYQSWESIKQTKLIMHSLHPLADQVLNFPVSM